MLSVLSIKRDYVQKILYYKKTKNDIFYNISTAIISVYARWHEERCEKFFEATFIVGQVEDNLTHPICTNAQPRLNASFYQGLDVCRALTLRRDRGPGCNIQPQIAEWNVFPDTTKKCHGTFLPPRRRSWPGAGLAGRGAVLARCERGRNGPPLAADLSFVVVNTLSGKCCSF